MYRRSAQVLLVAVMNFLAERMREFCHCRLSCVGASRERDVDNYYVPFSGGLDLEHTGQPLASPRVGHSARSGAVPPPKPPRRIARTAETPFASNWSSSRGRPDYSFRRGPEGGSVAATGQPSGGAARPRRSLMPAATRPPTPCVGPTASVKMRRCSELRV